MSVKPGMNAKEIAILHYQLLTVNNFEEWLKTIKKIHRKKAKKKGSRPYYWWNTGRKRIDEQGMSYSFKNKDERYSNETRQKFFFYRLDKEGNESGMPVPITLRKDPEDNDEWRVDVSSW
ncbi:MAG: hypothetical protein HWN66_10310 [Candidatus Helarchaeota archaeon]|nr:hypothetical protein [Candidatus Helarchaeota archaeon]